MFERLFAETGLSLDRLRAFLEVAANGSIVKAAAGDPVRQSQYSRQIKELEDFFRTKLVGRHASGLQLTNSGRELARISRFFLLGLSNFQRGCLAEEQTFRIAGSIMIVQKVVTPVLAADSSPNRYKLETLGNADIERRLHDLTIDFGIVTHSELSRPLQTKEIGRAGLAYYVPKKLFRERSAASRALRAKTVPLAISLSEMERSTTLDVEPQLVCESFLSAASVLASERFTVVLPDFLAADATRFWEFPFASKRSLRFHLAWNPRLLRLNPHAVREKDRLYAELKGQFRGLGVQ